MFSHLLIPLDGSELAEEALPHAIKLAVALGSQLTLVRVIDLPDGYKRQIGLVDEEIYERMAAELRNEAEAYMIGQKAAVSGQGIQVEALILPNQSVADAILETAESGDVDTIIMSTHGRSGIGRWMYGSIAEKILHQSDVPVLLIRNKELAQS